ncbi:MAG: hypothetical protein M3081_01515 [Gemmatimonadota bacterium]|nr:hypothetical protein [Gemmatimonadota bacterium]
MRSTKLLVFLAATIAVAGCIDTVKPPAARPYATVFLNISPTTPGNYVVAPTGTVFQAQILQLQNSRSAVDSCVLAQYSPPTDLPLDFISAGDSILLSIGGVTRYLKPVTTSGITHYVLAGAGTAGITPGALFTVTTPGAATGFPAATVSSNTPAAFTMSPINVLPNNSIEVKWTPRGDDSSHFTFALEYASGSSTLNVQIVCTTPDDGIDTVQNTITTGYRAATLRRVEAARWRTAQSAVGDATLYIYSAYNIPPFAP